MSETAQPSPVPAAGGCRPARAVFAILLCSYAFFWHTRDWNSASRLMLTYAMVDRGTIALDGLEGQTGDRATFQGHSYTDKLPGFSLLAAVPYGLAKVCLGLPDHPTGTRSLPLWPADYWATLGTAGLATAATGALLAHLAGRLGCGPRRSALVGLAYGLATPAYVYATLGYGHQVSAFALLASFALIWRADRGRRSSWALGLAGFAAAGASAVELQVGPASALLGLFALARAVRGQLRGSAVGAFALGAVPPTLTLLGYNLLAFGSPIDMGYFHHATQRFRDVHSGRNPLGLRRADWRLIGPLLIGKRRGLLLFAPILALALPGWITLALRRRWEVAGLSAAVCVALFAVNLSYPEWTGGWATGPRLLVPLLPFAMLPVASCLAVGGRGVWAIGVLLVLAGGAFMLLCQGIDGRIPEGYANPLVDPLWPFWRGGRLPWREPAGEVGWTPVAWMWPKSVRGLPTTLRWVQFLPLVAFQALSIAILANHLGKPLKPPRS